LLGVRAEVRYEGQAAMELEGLAAAHGAVDPLPGGMVMRGEVADFTPLLSRLADCADVSHGAALFHATLAAGLAEWLLAVPQGDFLRGAVDREKVAKMAIGGGCAMNAVLMKALRQRLEASGASVFEAKLAPPNDGGLALGQGWVARCNRNLW
jgi:hydrogenase maturation protein HypF